METALYSFMEGSPLLFLFLIIAVLLYILSKGADILVDEAVTLSIRWGIPKVIIGATIVSLGTTLPEAAVSVGAALQGNPDLAMGNAVGSVICDTALIIGLATLISPLKLDKSMTNRQGWMQFGSGLMLVLFSIPWRNFSEARTEGGHLTQWTGLFFVVLLSVYLVISMRWARKAGHENDGIDEVQQDEASSSLLVLFKLTAGVVLIITSSKILIPAISVGAVKIGIPQSVIAATLVAFGTSLPELVTAVTAARKGHGELAIGNIIGADILNVLFVAGFSSLVTPGGLPVPPVFLTFQFPVMIGALLIFRVATLVSKEYLTRRWGIVLLLSYIFYMVYSYI